MSRSFGSHGGTPRGSADGGNTSGSRDPLAMNPLSGTGSNRQYYSTNSYVTYLKHRVARHFRFEERCTSYSQEIRGGFVTFLTMSYILLVNPQILSYWVGGDADSVSAQVLRNIKVGYMDNIASSTALICGVGTLLVGVFTNLPFSIGPGMGMNTFFASMLMTAESFKEFGQARHSWDLAVTSTFVVGAVLFLLSIGNVAHNLVKYLPAVLKSSILVGIGLYQAFVALRTMKIIKGDPVELLTFVNEFDFSDTGTTGPVAQILFCVSLLVTSSLYVCQMNGAILIGIMFTTLICWTASVGGVTFPKMPIQIPVFDQTFLDFDFVSFFKNPQAIGACFSFLLITLFDVAGVMFGVQTLARELTRQQLERNAVERATALEVTDTDSANDNGDEDGNDAPSGKLRVVGDEGILRAVGGTRSPHHRPGGADDAERQSAVQQDGIPDDTSVLDSHEDLIAPWEARGAYVVIGFSTMLSGVLGCSPCIVFLECIAGVASGARTGFASVVCAVLFLVALPFVPIFRSVPPCASAPVLVIVGCFMMSSAADIPWSDHQLAMPAFITIILMPFTADITPGIVGGILAYVFFAGVGWLERAYSNWGNPAASGAAAALSGRNGGDDGGAAGAEEKRGLLEGHEGNNKGSRADNGGAGGKAGQTEGTAITIGRANKSGSDREGDGALQGSSASGRGNRRYTPGYRGNNTAGNLYAQPTPQGLRTTSGSAGAGTRSNRSVASDAQSTRSSERAWTQHTPHQGPVGFHSRPAEVTRAMNSSTGSNSNTNN